MLDQFDHKHLDKDVDYFKTVIRSESLCSSETIRSNGWNFRLVMKTLLVGHQPAQLSCNNCEQAAESRQGDHWPGKLGKVRELQSGQ